MSEIGSPSGTIIGYDPGGAEAHGFAVLLVEAGKAVRLSTSTVSTAEQVIELVQSTPGVVALGIDTLTCWATGPSGWRPADRWLRERYRPVAHSVVAPNALRGAMAVSGMAVLMAIANAHPTLFVTETHPKVLFWFLSQRSYNYTDRRTFMDDTLTRLLGVRATPANEHEWDAALSALAALEGLSGRWTHNLHSLPTRGGERLVTPGSATHYCWPE